MSEDSQALIREIEEEVRRERLTKLWNQYGTLAIGAVVSIVVLFGGWQWYSAYQLDSAQKAGGRFEEAIALLDETDEAKKKDGLALLQNLTDEGPAVYGVLAQLRLAATHRSASENDKAKELYQKVSDSSAADSLLRSFAKLQLASLKIDTSDWTTVQNQLNQIASDTGPWRLSARELLGLAAYKHKKWKEARQAYSSLLTEETATPAMKQRAQAALELITREEKAASSPVKTNDEKDAAKVDLKNDKSAGKGEPKGQAEANSPVSAPSKEAGTQENDTKTPKE